MNTWKILIIKSLLKEKNIGLRKNWVVEIIFLVFMTCNMFAATVDLTRLQDMVNALPNSPDDAGTLILPDSNDGTPDVYEIDGTLIVQNKKNITIDGNGKRIKQQAAYTTSIKISSCNSVTIGDLELEGHPGSYSASGWNYSIGLWMLNCAGSNYITGMSFLDHGSQGVFGQNTESVTQNVTFDNCYFDATAVDMGDNGNWNAGLVIGSGCDNWEVKNCRFYRTGHGIVRRPIC